MSELGTLARPYAKAAFEVALSGNVLGEWSQQLAAASALASTPEMQAVFNNPSLTSEQQALLFNDLCGESTSTQLKNLVETLAQNKRLALLPAIYSQYETLKEAQEKTLAVEIHSAYELDAQTQQRLIDILKNKFSREITASVIIDRSLIGGVLVRAGDVVIDGTAKGRLSQLADVMSA